VKHRIISLIASGTEIVSALGHGAELVGRSHECDFPPSIQSLPVCSEPRIDVHASSGEIDAQVRTAVGDALSVYSVFVDQLDRLHPTHLITQSQCEVCAVSLSDVQQAVCEMIGSQPEIVTLAPMDLNDIWDDIRRVAAALKDEQRGNDLVQELQRRLKRVQSAANQGQARPRVVCLEWLDPLMSAGNWVPELVELAGGIPLLCEAGKHSPYFGWSDLLSADPDVIAIMPCGFDMARTSRELGVLTGSAVWMELKAVQQGRVYLTDGNQFFNRPGPRVVESAEILAEILHPSLSDAFGHRGTGWARLEVKPSQP
jgi:iron complex transport system substrate-binding protein